MPGAFTLSESHEVCGKTRSGYEVVRKLVERADVVIDPFRPGVMERLGLGPDVFLGKEGTNQRLIFARLVGFPRTGPHKNMAGTVTASSYIPNVSCTTIISGHDLNYLALTGVLSVSTHLLTRQNIL